MKNESRDDERKPRARIVEYLGKVLFGPLGGEFEKLAGTPFLRYMTGMLFPVGDSVGKGESEVTASADEGAGEVERDELGRDVAASGIALAFEALPSAVGISFCVPDEAEIRCEAWAARYEQGEQAPGSKAGRAAREWSRVPLATEERPAVVLLRKDSTASPILGGRAEVATRWRSRSDGTAIVTVSLVNRQRTSRPGLDPAATLFQVGLRCAPSPRGVLPYPEMENYHGGESEETEVAFLYSKSTPFARGHGAAATWADGDGMAPRRWVAVEFIPAVEVPSAAFGIEEGDGVDEQTFEVDFIDRAPRAELIRRFRALRDAYDAWLARQGTTVVPGSFAAVFAALQSRAGAWSARIGQGIDLLESDDRAWLAFHLANKAMGMQMVLSRWTKDGPHALAKGRGAPSFAFQELAWRPFQVAFMLGVLESTWNVDSDDRSTVDVIWFPTGGGKTEAYLFLSAFELVRRRLAHGDSDTATAILSRYTLRLLTAQQFQRTSALICALELIRRSHAQELGARRFSLGLWVGGEPTPNTCKVAHEKFQEMMESSRPRNPFLVQSCPCCGTEIVPARPSGRTGAWAVREFGVKSGPGSFTFNCPSRECPFHEELPLNVVDQELYARPPSMLVGTIDKFAQLPWSDSSRSFFGGVDDKSPPPSLVIQDELHLISGPLGSIAGAYEAALDTVLALRGANPKRIASTATIRNAREQVRGLYGREAAVFPTPVTRWDDAYFFSTEAKRAGRMYVGVMGQGYTKPVVAMAWTAAALLQAPMEVELDDASRDGYWSVLAYHNSRRELGRTIAAAHDEIAARIKAISSAEDHYRPIGEPLELSAQMVKSLGEALDELKRRNAPGQAAVDFVPCTSIVSVGVDVDRLAVMLVNGQPKLTSEYIQATSRIGRGAIPGLVVTLFSPSKPRDRSHYEDFRSYHDGIYRHVEPTSVTPYSIPSRERTLHAAMVTVVRHALKWRAVDQACAVDFGEESTKDALEMLLRTMEAADPSEAQAVRRFLAQRVGEWIEFAQTYATLLYEHRGAGMAFPSLLYDFGKPAGGGLWPTMGSVRNVDAEVDVSIC